MSLLQMSFSASVMILVVLVIRMLAINRLPKKTFLALWAIVLCRLIIPLSVPSRFSVYSLASRMPTSSDVNENTAANFIPAPISVPTSGSPIPAKVPEASLSPITIIWIVGFIICALFFVITYFKCCREFQASMPVENKFTIGWLDKHKIARPIQIRQSSIISAPLTYSIFNPVILMPQKTDWGNETQLQYVLTHEYVHIRRFDAVTKLLLAASLCVHWFNPLVWVMYILANRDIELSCDEAVVLTFGESIKSAYALTLISMEEKKSGLTHLCNNFSKNAIEERIKAIMKMKKTSVISVLVALTLIGGVITAFATTADSKSNALSPIANTAFTADEYDKLIALQFDGYEDMSITEYREKVNTLTDTWEYRDLLERMSQDIQLQDMRYTNETASFFFNTLEPISAEKWEQRDFGNYVQYDYSAQADPAVLEYYFTRTILDANQLTVGEHIKTVQGVNNGFKEFLQGKSSTELQDEELMDKAIRIEIKRLKNKYETDALHLDISYFFTPLTIYDVPAENSSSTDNIESEKRGTPGTEEDYQLLLSLKTPNYQNQSVADFNYALLEQENEMPFFEASQRICSDVQWGDIQVNLTDDELSFISLTIPTSEKQNGANVRSNYTGKPKEDPVLNYRFDRNLPYVWCNLDFWLSYHVSDENKLTIGERDRCLSNIVNDIKTFWDEKSIDELVAMNKETISTQLDTIASQYSNEIIQVKVKDIVFENHDERNLENEHNLLDKN